MKTKRIVYWLALAVTGLCAVAVKLWAFSTGHSFGPVWEHVRHGYGPPMGLPLLGLVLVVGVALWYRRRDMPGAADPWEALGMEYVEGRMTRDEFLARRAVLEEQRWN